MTHISEGSCPSGLDPFLSLGSLLYPKLIQFTNKIRILLKNDSKDTTLNSANTQVFTLSPSVLKE